MYAAQTSSVKQSTRPRAPLVPKATPLVRIRSSNPWAANPWE